MGTEKLSAKNNSESNSESNKVGQSAKFSYISQENVEYIENQYQSFLKNPDSVDANWKMFFEGIEFAKSLPAELGGFSTSELQVFNLIRAYRDYGHFEANLNPLASGTKSFPELSFHNFGLTEADQEKNFKIGSMIGMPNAKLKDIISQLRSYYCRTISIQVHDAMPTVRDWFFKEFEKPEVQPAKEEKIEIHNQLVKTESFEKFIHTRYVGKKRFSIEGGDSLIPMLEKFVSTGPAIGVEELVLGMAHRGRVNVLVNFMGKALPGIFAEFEGIRDENNSFFDGDVKYHLGFSTDKKTPSGNCHISLAFNPSHLEAVNPVVLGMVRAKQRRRDDTASRKKVIPILIHGDGAMIGQGVVAETFTMSGLKGYTVGGTIHICIDNQVAFTANPENERSSPYSSDMAKIIQAPVLHVNGDDVEACVRAAELAIRYRQEFKRDVVINVICYRRFGHNEGDEPMFTQPLMYTKIKAHPTALEIYTRKLESEKVITHDESDQVFKARIDELQKILDQTRKQPPAMKPLAFEGLWKGFRRAEHADFEKTVKTQAELATLKKVAELLTHTPESFSLNSKVQKLLGSRAKMMEGDGAIDWGMGELLTYGSLLYEGTSVRLSGQDSIRGTFSHRHSAYYDQKNGEKFSPLTQIRPDDVEFCVYDSPLSEYAVMGFEYGNSSSDPTFLTIWEAQFGDFVNGAQIILDQFISSAEQKWQRMSGLVLLLPHGYEGQGPEHSSARLERFLQMCAQDNIQVCNVTTPAQLFHVLRRQVKRDFRKPLVIMSPKSLLRHPLVISKLKDFTDGGFSEVIPDLLVKPKEVESAILCSGKVYYDLLAAKDKIAGNEKVALIRVEQLYPLPEHKLVPLFKSFNGLKKLVWCQEEPKNMGAWTFIQSKMIDLFLEQKLDLKISYAGRTERASPATGSEKVHQAEQAELVQNAYNQALSVSSEAVNSNVRSTK
jgi:2-oxoglutarate dehydrogenase E1 component